MFIEQGLLFRESSCLCNNDCFIEVLSLATKGLTSLANWHLTVAISGGRSVSLGGLTAVLYLWKLMPIADKETLIRYQNVSAAHKPKMNPARIVKDVNGDLTSAFALFTRPPFVTRKACCLQTVWASRTVCRPYH